MRMFAKPILHTFPLDFFHRKRALMEREDFPLRKHLSRGRYPQRMMRYFIAHETIRAHQKALGRRIHLVDLGCERGLLKMLSGDQIDAYWVGLDWNLTRPTLQSAGYDELHQADFDAPLPVNDNYADALVSLHVFEHLPRPEFTAAEIFRALKPGGIFVMGVPVVPRVFTPLREKQYRAEMDAGKRQVGRHINKFHVQRAIRLLSSVGFEVEWWTGTHFLRVSGSHMESWPAWVRMNQWWGWNFPYMAGELYLKARKP
jgi:SAM-dependent methyltransferase